VAGGLPGTDRMDWTLTIETEEAVRRFLAMLTGRFDVAGAILYVPLDARRARLSPDISARIIGATPIAPRIDDKFKHRDRLVACTWYVGFDGKAEAAQRTLLGG